MRETIKVPALGNTTKTDHQVLSNRQYNHAMNQQPSEAQQTEHNIKFYAENSSFDAQLLAFHDALRRAWQSETNPRVKNLLDHLAHHSKKNQLNRQARNDQAATFTLHRNLVFPVGSDAMTMAQLQTAIDNALSNTIFKVAASENGSEITFTFAKSEASPEKPSQPVQSAA